MLYGNSITIIQVFFVCTLTISCKMKGTNKTKRMAKIKIDKVNRKNNNLIVMIHNQVKRLIFKSHNVNNNDEFNENKLNIYKKLIIY